MSLHLRFSHRTEQLLEALQDLLGGVDPLGPDAPTIVVPSPSVARWLKLRLSERSGVVLGLETTTLESFLWSALDPSPRDELLRVPLLQQSVLEALEDLVDGRSSRMGSEGLPGSEGSWDAVRRFLRPEGVSDPRRKVPFAQEMARLFLEYEYNRPSVWSDGWVVKGLDQTWPESAYFHREDGHPVEAWQKELHGAAFDPAGVLGSRSGQGMALGLPRLHRLQRDGGWIPWGGPVALFAVEKVSHFHRNLLLELSQGREVHAFLHNPCAAFWEDLDTSRRRSRRPSSAPSHDTKFRRHDPIDEWCEPDLPERWYPSPKLDPVLLERWGRTARENVALWCQAAEYDFLELACEEPVPPTLLGDLQEALRQRHPGPLLEPLERPDGTILDGPREPDPSMLLLEAPDRGREMETLRDLILGWLEEDASRRPGDVVVYLPDPARHRVEIERVFGAYASHEPGWLPWALVGTPSAESLWARGVEGMLALVEGVFDRPSVFTLLRNPVCRKRLGLEAETVSLWERWFEGTGTIRAWDRDERADEAEATDVHTVSAGIRRLLVAGLGHPQGVRLGPDEEPIPGWRDFDAADPDLLDAFCSTLEDLHHEVRSLAGKLASTSPAHASKFLLEALDRWLDPSDSAAEASVRRSLQEALRHAERRSDRPLPPGEWTEIVRGALEGELPGSSRAWTGGVTFAPLRTGDILPHRLVLVAGLDADAFPGEPRQSSLDLLAGARIVGDPDPVADNRHAFLLTLLAARESLVLSWRARDIQKDEPKDPSSVVLELEDALRRGFTSRSLRRRIRLLEREPARDSLELPQPGWDSWERPARPLPDPSRELAEPSHSQDSPTLDTRTLSGFVLDAWSHRIESELEAEERDGPDTLGTADEPLEATALAHTKVRNELFPLVLRHAWEGIPGERTRSEAMVALHASRWDSGFPEGLQMKREESDLGGWVDGLREHVLAWKARWPKARLETGCDLGLRLPGAPQLLELDLGLGHLARFSARLPAALLLEPDRPESSAVVVIAPARWSPTGSCPLRKSLEPRLWAHLFELAGRVGSRAVLVPTRGGTPSELEPLPCDGAWLQSVVHDLLGGNQEFLPSTILVDQGKLTLAQVREALEEAAYRPALQQLLDPELPGEEDGDDALFASLVRRRFGPLLEDDPEAEDDS
jgi:exonuclease V gamma subunit